MPVFFYIDSEMAADWNCRNVDDVTLSYRFYKVGPGVLRIARLNSDLTAFVKQLMVVPQQAICCSLHALSPAD
jgi:hypothetical protein